MNQVVYTKLGLSLINRVAATGIAWLLIFAFSLFAIPVIIEQTRYTKALKYFSFANFAFPYLSFKTRSRCNITRIWSMFCKPPVKDVHFRERIEDTETPLSNPKLDIGTTKSLPFSLKYL